LPNFHPAKSNSLIRKDYHASRHRQAKSHMGNVG